MARKKREVEIEENIEEVKPSNTWKFVGVGLFALGCLFGASLLSSAPEDTLNLFYKLEALLFGKMAFVLPLVFIACGLKLMLSKKLGYFNRFVWGSVLMLLCLLGMSHLFFAPNEASAIETWQRGGGFFGAMIIKALGGIAGETATGIALAIIFVVALLVVLPLSVFAMVLGSLWNKITSLFKSDDDEDDDDDPKGTYINREKPRTREDKPVYSEPKRITVNDNEGLNPRDIYHSSEFDSFNEGIKKESAYKKVLNFGKTGTYDDIKEEIHEDPVQIPEWEEGTGNKAPRSQWDEKKNISQGRIIHWEDLAKEQEAKKAAQAQEPVNASQEYAIGTSSGDGVITNFYKEEETNTPVENVVPITPEVQVTEPELEPEPEKPVSITIEDSADKIEGPVLTEAEAKAQEEQKAVQAKPQSKYIKPPVSLLNPPVRADRASWEQGVKEQCGVLEKTLADFKVKAKVINVTRGPSVTRFELEPAAGVKVASIVNLADDIALRLAASGVRIEAPIPGKSAVGIEAPNLKNDMVAFREVVDTDVVKKDPSRLAIGLGKNISGDIISADLGKMPHTLIAGSTGSGKSVCVNTIIAGLLYKASPEEVKLILVDPKVVELSNYNGIPHLLTPVVTDPKKAASALRWGVNEMERRYQLFADNHVREITSYNKKDDVEKLPYIVIIIDELADLMMVAKVDVEEAILRLAQKARACGIHLILATQRPSVDVITGIVKANIPSRVAFAVSSQTDSRTILDGSGAEKLLGKGDMLFKPVGVNTPMRVQGAFVTDEELAKIVDFVKQQGIATEYNEEVTKVELSSDKEKDKAAPQEASGEAANDGPVEDALFEDALRLVLDTGQVSSSMLQRRFRIGYTRAARLVDTFEELGIVGQSVGAKPREVIMSRQEVEERFLNH
ncbi:MAG: DNA translocase FtsK [Phascolarctobacterium sp.]|nr:DNA translocase FtsK [Phascolarctobacterium sp.]